MENNAKVETFIALGALGFDMKRVVVNIKNVTTLLQDEVIFAKIDPNKL